METEPNWCVPHVDAVNAAERFNTILLRNSIHAVCIGGAPRDLWHGRTPKDFDFVTTDVVGPREAAELISTLRNTVGVSDVEFFDSYNGDDTGPGHHDCEWVLKCKVDGVAFDLIQLKEWAGSVEDALASVESTLNQAWLDIKRGEPTKVRVVPGYPSLSEDFPVRHINLCTQARWDHIKAKYPAYRYEVNPELIVSEPTEGIQCVVS